MLNLVGLFSLLIMDASELRCFLGLGFGLLAFPGFPLI